MRKAYNDYHFWIGENDEFMGVSLGFDFTSEHEWGIAGMRRMFGIPDSSKDKMGIKSRTITKCPESLVFREEKHKGQKFAVLYADRYRNNKEQIPSELSTYKDDILRDVEWLAKNPKVRNTPDQMVTAWDEESFGVGVMGEKEVGYLKELYEAFKKNNVAIAFIDLHPGNPFSNASLSLLILDKIPEKSIEQMYSADKSHYDLIDYEEEIGMTKIKQDARKNGSGFHGLHYYMACSPRWINYEDTDEREKSKLKNNTKYDILYWINYSDDDNNFGWYTVEEIKEWLTGTRKLTEIRKAN